MENGAPHSNTDSSEPSSGGSLVVADRSDPVGMGLFGDDSFDEFGEEALAELEAHEREETRAPRSRCRILLQPRTRAVWPENDTCPASLGVARGPAAAGP